MTKVGQKKIRILAIETSCDETSASLIEAKFKVETGKLKVIDDISIKSNVVSSQVKLHSKYGGVYPELASREHTKNIIPVIQAALKEARSKRTRIKYNLSNSPLDPYSLILDADYIACTSGPGLIGSLLVGVNTAKTIAFSLNKPFIDVNHLEGHIYANFIVDEISVNPKSEIRNAKQPQFPLISLVVSGGHTSLILMKKHLNYEIIGETCDDAAGEAYDKVASMLGLSYPGGPVIDALASKYKVESGKSKVRFPRPMIDDPNFDFSFSGLKTAVLYYLQKQKKPFSDDLIKQVCYEFQEALTDVLVAKTLKAAQKYQVKSILLGGGVAANFCLREKIKQHLCHCEVIRSNLSVLKDCHAAFHAARNDISLFIPEPKFCTDNAAVIGIAAAYKLLAEQTSKWYDIEADSNKKL